MSYGYQENLFNLIFWYKFMNLHTVVQYNKINKNKLIKIFSYKIFKWKQYHHFKYIIIFTQYISQNQISSTPNTHTIEFSRERIPKREQPETNYLQLFLCDIKTANNYKRTSYEYFSKTFIHKSTSFTNK